MEPDPAEVSGEEGEEHDSTLSTVPGPFDRDRPDTLSERLAEEEPEESLQAPSDEWAGELVDPGRGGGEVDRAEADDPGAGGDEDEPGTEEAAIHVRDGEAR